MTKHTAAKPWGAKGQSKSNPAASRRKGSVDRKAGGGGAKAPAATTAAPQLNFGLNNPDAPGTIYISSNPADNQLTLAMSSTVAAGFTAGKLVPPGDAQTGSGSLLYLYMSPLGLTDAEFSAIRMVSTGWSAELYTDSSGQYIGFTPTGPLTLQPAPIVISFAVKGFTLANAPGNSASLYVLAYRVSGIAGNFPSSSNISVIFANPSSDTGDLTTAMSVSLTPNEVVNSVPQYPEIANKLNLVFAQQPNAPTINAGADTAFTLNFVYATDVNGYGALFNVAEGKQLQVTAGSGATDWQIDTHFEADPPFWTLTPPAGEPLFSGGAGSTLAFQLANLVTNFQPGPTEVIISYSGVPGYKNGSFAITLVKEPHVVISSLTVSPEQSVLTDGQATVTLNWSTTNATQLTLQPLGTDVTGKTSTQATISETTSFTLVAEGQRPGNVDNVASQSVLAQVLPVINGFTASPSSIYVGDFGSGYPVNLAWNVNTNDQVALTSSTTGPSGPLYPAVSSIQMPLSTPQMLTLTPKGGSKDPTVSRNLVVSGFQIEAQTVPLGKQCGYCAVPSNGSFVAVTLPSSNAVSIRSTASYAEILQVPTGNQPSGIAFSADGSLMYVANAGDGTVSIFTVAATQSYPAFSFTPLATVTVGGRPAVVAVGPDGTAWVGVSMSSPATSDVVVQISNLGGTFKARPPLAVGKGLSGLSLAPNGASLYVSCATDGTIWMIIVTSGVPGVGKILSGLSNPTATAVTPDGKMLLVTASGATAQDGYLYGYNTQSPSTSPRQALQLAYPSGVATFPTGDYAVVTSTSNTNSVALVNYTTWSVSTTQTLPAGSNNVSIAPEGGLAFVAMAGNNAIEVMTFAEYAQVAATTAAGGQVTNVAVSPDNKTLIGWANAMIGTNTGGSGSPLSGLVKGPVSGIGFAHLLAGAAINWAAISPHAKDDALYIAPHGSAAINVYTLSSMAALATIPIQGSGPAGRQPVALGVSPDGQTLFALVADNSTQYSMVVISANVATKAFTVVADMVVYTASEAQLATPLAVVPTDGGGSVAWTLDTTTNNLWKVSGSGSAWQVAANPIALASGVSGAAAQALACSPDGSTAYAVITKITTNYIAVADLAANTANLVELPDSVQVMNLTSLAVSADGQSLYACDVAGAGIRILNAKSLRIDQTMSWQAGVQMPYGIAVASDGSALFSANVNSQNIAIAQQVSPA